MNQLLESLILLTCCCEEDEGDFGVGESSPLSSSSEILNSRSSVYLFLFTCRLERRFWKEETHQHLNDQRGPTLSYKNIHTP